MGDTMKPLHTQPPEGILNKRIDTKLPITDRSPVCNFFKKMYASATSKIHCPDRALSKLLNDVDERKQIKHSKIINQFGTADQAISALNSRRGANDKPSVSDQKARKILVSKVLNDFPLSRASSIASSNFSLHMFFDEGFSDLGEALLQIILVEGDVRTKLNVLCALYNEHENSTTTTCRLREKIYFDNIFAKFRRDIHLCLDIDECKKIITQNEGYPPLINKILVDYVSICGNDNDRFEVLMSRKVSSTNQTNLVEMIHSSGIYAHALRLLYTGVIEDLKNRDLLGLVIRKQKNALELCISMFIHMPDSHPHLLHQAAKIITATGSLADCKKCIRHSKYIEITFLLSERIKEWESSIKNL